MSKKKFEKATRDRNFDDIADRFSEGIYGNLKGRIRLEVLKRDFAEAGIGAANDDSLNILDAGGGSGQFSCFLSQQANHAITLADPSIKMLEKAKAHYQEQSPEAEIEFLHSSVQDLPAGLHGGYDLILFHAVLEWLVEPIKTLDYLLNFLKPGGALSLLFYNKQGLVLRHLTLGNFHFVEKGYLSGVGVKSLTPISPQVPQDVVSALTTRGYEQLCHSGVRCFYDFISPLEKDKLEDDDVIRLELMHSQQDPYREIARYVHLLLRKPLS